MKKVLSISLVLCMLLALCAPLTVSAWEYAPGEITNTSEIFTDTSNTALGAYRGTPNLTETTGSLKDSAWDNAVALPLNSTTKPVIKNASFNDGVNADFYFLWDETYLYILEEYKDTAIGTKNKDLSSIGDNYEHWRNTHTSSLYNIMLPSDTILSAVMVTTIPNGNVTLGGDILEGLVRVRYYSVAIDYSGTSNPGKTKLPVTDSRLDVSTRTQKTETGFMQETKVAWSTLTALSGVSFTPADAAKIGIKIGAKKSDGTSQTQYHVNHSGNDYLGFDCMTLSNTKTNEDRTVRPSEKNVIADVEYWQTNLTATEGQVFEISTPERLLGLAAFTHTTSSDQSLTKGDTFKLTADIDLNAAVNYETTSLKSLIPSDNLYYWEVNQPYTIWPKIDLFSGTFDGQGHTVRGLFHYAGDGTPAAGGNTADNGYGFIGRLKDGAVVKNLIIDDSYIQGDADDVCFAAVVGTAHTSNSTIENVYVGSNVTVEMDETVNNDATYGAILGSTWGNSSNHVIVKNVQSTATVIGRSGYGGFLIGCVKAVRLTLSNAIFDKSNSNNTSTVTQLYGFTGNSGVYTDGGYNYIITDETSATTALTEAAGYMVDTELGVMPVKLADMMSTYKWQATKAEGGKFDVRIVAEVASDAYDAVGFKVLLYKNGVAATTWVNNVDNVNIYSAVKANKGTGVETLGASTFNEGFMDGANNALFTITLNNLDATATWKVEVVAVYTIGTDVIESAVAQTTTVSPWN